MILGAFWIEVSRAGRHCTGYTMSAQLRSSDVDGPLSDCSPASMFRHDFGLLHWGLGGRRPRMTRAFSSRDQLMPVVSCFVLPLCGTITGDSLLAFAVLVRAQTSMISSNKWRKCFSTSSSHNAHTPLSLFLPAALLLNFLRSF